MASSKARVPVKFSVQCYEAINERLPDGRSLEIPRHWRMLDGAGHVIASGPYQSEPVILALVKLSAAFTARHAKEARELVTSLQHITRKVALVGPTGAPLGVEATPDVGSDEWWAAYEAQLPKGQPLQ